MTGNRLRMFVFLLVSWVFIAVPVMAQDKTCPEIVQAALDTTDSQCSATGRNEACYGNVDLEATPQPSVENFNFSAPGDIVPVNSIDNFTLSSRVEETGEWGVALLQLQANLPDSLPGQNVMFLLFGDVEITNAVDTNVDTELNPMQAFYFHSGSGDAPCSEAPDSGILVQTPEGAATIDFTVNDVDITLGSTAYLQAQPGGQMTTSVVEGEATVTAGGATVIVPAGSQVQVPLDAQGQANGTPSQPQPYDAAKMAVLPIRILPRTISIAPPIGVADDIVPAAGTWQATWVPPSISCDVVSETLNGTLTWDMSYYGSFMLPEGEFTPALLYGSVLGFDLTGIDITSSSPAPNQYVMDFSGGVGDVHFEVQVTDTEHMTGSYTLTKSNCVYAFTYEMARTGE
jgi:hypothetical protein